MNTALSKVLAVYINLDKSEDRRAHIARNLDDLSFNHQRFKGINGHQIEDLEEFLSLEHFARCHGRICRPGEVGCYFSHLGAIKQFLETDYEYGLILEDDALLTQETADLIADLISPEMSSHWDFAKLQSRRTTKMARAKQINEKFALTIPFTRSTGATAYLINRKAGERLRTTLEVMEVPYDHAFDRPAYLGIKYRAISPFPVKLEDDLQSRSNIETSRPQKRKGLAKIPALWWRTKSEVSRFLWACGTTVAVKLSPR